MRNPRDIEVFIPGAAYQLPLYSVTDQGITDFGMGTIAFCKGDKTDNSVFRQSGMFTESIIEVAKRYLESVNKGELANRDTAMAITKLDEALLWLNKRTADRVKRGVEGTNNK